LAETDGKLFPFGEERCRTLVIFVLAGNDSQEDQSAGHAEIVADGPVERERPLTGVLGAPQVAGAVDGVCQRLAAQSLRSRRGAGCTAKRRLGGRELFAPVAVGVGE